MDETKVVFKISDGLVQKLFDSAEEKCLLNIKDFAGRKVLIEGGGYNKVWIETQPMGGAMYGKRNLEVAYNNQKIFMDHQRQDGRLPGSIEYADGKLIPQYDKFQGFCFPAPALDVYYMTGKDPQYLEQLYEVLRKYDEYLWKVRDSDNDGCLESWCRFDTGEDNALRYGDAPDYWESDEPPRGYDTVPIASMDFMSYSYSAKKTMAEIALIKGDKELYEKHRKDADDLKRRIREILWNEEKGAFYDRDNKHRQMDVLTHNNLRMMYWRSMSEADAKRFVKEHLLNKKEFWTKFPLPSVAISDPLYRNDEVNNWSGQAQALTYQRAIPALENYGYYNLIPKLGAKLFEAIGEDCIFVQQYDPDTMKPSLYGVDGRQDAYGPAMLAVLEYISRMYGVVLMRDKLIWSSIREDTGYYEQHIGGHVYKLEHTKDKAYAFIDGKQISCFERGTRLETDLSGKELIRYNDL
ncbi:MAG: hypothetical protein J6M44_12865 [Butyrivibrio sp.]|nr:hypothetical protein [Butyrivibrio sp.]MBP3825335.1 hypothetical protein [Butyrivibrio sp.]